MSALDNELLIAFYGDDFTGSTDALEALATQGLHSVLFLSPPSPELLQNKFPGIQCVGVAGVSRSMTRAEMERELRPTFQKLLRLQARVVHYKVCSTFDSSPSIGSIGYAIDLGRETFVHQRVIPLVVGAPSLKRFTVFGNNFATVGSETYRLDRHPTMAHHPVTPMTESDLRRHLAKQTEASIGLMDLFALTGDECDVISRYRNEAESGPDVMLFDVLDDERLRNVGAVLWKGTKEGSEFVVGSSGVEYALTAYWKSSGVIDPTPKPFLSPGPVNQLLALSGSCSPVTREQIHWAFENGFEGLHLPSEILLESSNSNSYTAFVNHSLQILQAGKSLVIYTAVGPDDPEIDNVRKRFDLEGIPFSESGERIGKRLGQIMRQLVSEAGLRRVMVAGGDTSGHATKELGIYAMEMICPVAPGGPLCRCYSDDPAFDGLELVLKGGQVGKADYFGRVLHGLQPGETASF